MNKTASLIIVVALIVGIGIIVLGASGDNQSTPGAESAQNIDIRDGVQYITVNARGGYAPRLSSAKANMPTKLIMKTDGTYDCSASLAIRSIGYQKILPNTGEEVIDLGTPQAGTIEGLCSMGMYNFSIDFQ